ncbi:MAG: glycosyltransferase family 4 protein [Anaerolineales bacterium]|nr:glycosyltransferase family 4 protein [Anaerolineales bacterium]
MIKKKPTTALLHYSAPPVIGGVEGVIQAHCQIFLQKGYPVTVIAGRGEKDALPPGADFTRIAELDSQHPDVLNISKVLEQGQIPQAFEPFTRSLVDSLAPVVRKFDNLIVHNVFTKHFNLPLTSALSRLVTSGDIRHCIAWCHDFTWTSPNSRSKVFEGYPWDLLRTYDPQVQYVTISQERLASMTEMLGQPAEKIKVIYNGVDVRLLLGISDDGYELIQRMDILAADLVLLMPVRVTQAKNIEFALRLTAELKALGISPRLIHTGPPDPHDEKSMTYFETLRQLRRQLGIEKELRFVFESGPKPDEPYWIDLETVGELYRVADIMLMPSHREGFGMPVLEAGLAGIPVAATANVPAVVEIAGSDAVIFDASLDPAVLAGSLLNWMENNHEQRMRRRMRQQYTWQALFERDIQPLLKPNPDDAIHST